jgi:hypothetical protein
MAPVAYWAKAQLRGPTWWPLGWPMLQRMDKARAVHARHLVTMQCAASVRGVVWCSPVRRWLNGDEVFILAILMGPSTSRNTKN